MATSTNLWQQTPLIYSSALSESVNAEVYLKLETLHPSFSFKYRGISHFVRIAKEKHGSTVHIVIASGGNAGLAAACAARALGVSCSVFIPQWASKSTIDVLQQEKANVIVTGRHYPDALAAARDLVNREPEAVMVPAYDDPVVWEGHSSMITEIHSQMERKPDAIFCSVGGAGLLGGILLGCKQVGWDDVPVVALETIGSDCFYHSLSLNGGRFNATNKSLPPGIDVVYDSAHDVFLAHMNAFTSRAAGSLGAASPAAGIVKMALERNGAVKSLSVPDELSMEAMGFFADDHKILVELACSTTLVPAYHPSLFNKLVLADGDKKRVVIFVVCGGFKVSLADAAEFQSLVAEDAAGPDDTWSVKYDDGTTVQINKAEARRS